MEKLTEKTSHYNDLEKMSVMELLKNINTEDKSVPDAVALVLPQIENLISAIVERMKMGGRIFYIGAGTSGRLGIVDASECPPTFGVPQGVVIGLIAGGDQAIRKAVEFAEDDETQAWKDILPFGPNEMDVVIGIAASGSTPYVVGGLREATENGLLTGAIVCNAGSAVAAAAKHAIEVLVGPEFLTGSTRMKAGTAQKLVLNMISTCSMIQLGKVKGNKMVDMQLSNHKLIHRGIKMVMDELHVSREEAQKLLQDFGSVRGAIEAARK